MSGPHAITSTLVGLARTLGHALVSEQVARQPGLLQALDPRVRLVGLMSLVLAVVLSHRIAVVAGVLAVAIVLALLSHVRLATLASRVWLVVLAFTGVIAIPALFLTPGAPEMTAFGGRLVITSQGITAATLLIVRVETAVTLTTLLVLTTRWMDVLRALRTLHVPSEVVMMLAMTHRYIFLLAETAGQMLESRQSRTVGQLKSTAQRHMTARTAGVLLSKSVELSSEVYLAMQSRGFNGNARVLSEFRMRAIDYLGLAGFLLIGIAAAWIGRS